MTNERYNYAKAKQELREIKKRCENMEKVARKANRLVIESRDELGVVCFAVLKELDKILAATKKISNMDSVDIGTEIQIEKIEKITKNLCDRVSKVHDD